MKRILHIVGGMNRGGVETWLMHVLRHIDRTQYQMDFLVHTTQPCAYDEEILSLGSQIIPCMHPSTPLAYAKKLRRILEAGQYDVVHSHVHHYSGWILRIAAQARVPVRIAHSHTGGLKHKNLPRLTYELIMKWLIRRFATHGIGISETAARSLFSKNWEADKKVQIILYGFDFSCFNQLQTKDVLKQELGISLDRFVIGHVGRFVDVKNHALIIDVFEQLRKDDLNVHLLLVGDGPLHTKIQEYVDQHHLTSYCTMTGSQSTTSRFFGAMDLFLFPSLFEGLGIVVLEAQAAGVPCVISNAIPHEVEIIPDLITRVDLEGPLSDWVEILKGHLKYRLKPLSNTANIVAQSNFGIERNLRDLTDIYLSGSKHT